jgi:muconolactone delta-isomerase
MQARVVLTMDYLVTVTTCVPAGTRDAAVAVIRLRESARSGELALQGHLRRLWRPPLQPGEWRTLGLFAAADGAQLEEVLASMPLRVWRTDDVMPLFPHPNDPARPPGKPTSPAPEAAGEPAEFLTTFTLTIPAGTPARADGDVEAQRARELAGQGHVLRLWTLSGQGRALSLWEAGDTAGMQPAPASLPLDAWTSVETTPLSPHPSDPAPTNR